MSTLLLRLAGPMQAWGVESKFDTRQSGREPSKSGVIGLLAAALGRQRDSDISDLTRLKFGVRVDREGKLLRDFQMVQEGVKKPYLTNRYYLSDAVFLVGLESDDAVFLTSLEEALKTPRFPLFLGRRSCPPTLPIVLGLRKASLLEALKEEPYLCTGTVSKGEKRLRIITDTLEGEMVGARVKDMPLSFSSYHREYMYRKVIERGFITINGKTEVDHDPMSELR